MHQTSSTIASLAPTILFTCALSAFLPAAVAAQGTGEPVIYLNQAWSQEDREWYHNFSQGSAILPYDIFLNLEVADGQVKWTPILGPGA